MNPQDLTSMRAEAAKYLPDTCNVKRPTRSSDGAGGTTVVLSAVAANVPCRAASSGGGEATATDKVTATDTWVVTVPYDTDLSTSDRIEWAGRVLEVVAVQGSTFATVRRAICTGVVA